jgi:hypothetical protein
MKNLNNSFYKALDKTEINNLTIEIKETVSTDSTLTNSKQIFSSADLWNIQKMSRTTFGRRRNLMY